MKHENPFIYDWTIVHKITGAFLGEYGLVSDPGDAVSFTASNRSVSASAVKQGCFTKCYLKGLTEKDFKAHDGAD